jgi:hypothetical protein
MLTKTDYSLPLDLLKRAAIQVPGNDFKLTINQPTGRFFYDPWELKPEFKNTVWEEVYNTLPVVKGEARLINLKKESCYVTHSDIDDRYHLNITGEDCYLINLTDRQLFPIEQDGTWYNMDAGFRHSAVNFGVHNRVQLVVRQLLNDTQLSDSMSIIIKPVIEKLDNRFLFDKTLSPWLNWANKNNLISNFDVRGTDVMFNLKTSELESLKNIMPNDFKLIVG